MITRLKELALRLWLYFNGVRFYHREFPQNVTLVREADFRVSGGQLIKFSFYREELNDIVLRRGKISHEKSHGFIIRAQINKNFPGLLPDYNDVCFFFNARVNRLSFDDTRTTNLLLEIYLDYLVAMFEKEHELRK